MSDVKVAVQERLAREYQALTTRRRQDADGVVVTPVEVVDFQIRGVIDSLDVPLTDPRVRVMDPFGGTGIYLARLLQIAPLNAAEKVDLARRCRMVEIDPLACEIARRNLDLVMWEETGTIGTRPLVIQSDTFTHDEDIWEATEGAA